MFLINNFLCIQVKSKYYRLQKSYRVYNVSPGRKMDWKDTRMVNSVRWLKLCQGKRVYTSDESQWCSSVVIQIGSDLLVEFFYFSHSPLTLPPTPFSKYNPESTGGYLSFTHEKVFPRLYPFIIDARTQTQTDQDFLQV